MLVIKKPDRVLSFTRVLVIVLDESYVNKKSRICCSVYISVRGTFQSCFFRVLLRFTFRSLLAFRVADKGRTDYVGGHNPTGTMMPGLGLPSVTRPSLRAQPSTDRPKRTCQAIGNYELRQTGSRDGRIDRSNLRPNLRNLLISFIIRE